MKFTMYPPLTHIEIRMNSSLEKKFMSLNKWYSFYKLKFETDFIILFDNPNNFSFLVLISHNLNEKETISQGVTEKSQFIQYKSLGEREVHFKIIKMKVICQNFKQKTREDLHLFTKIDQIFNLNETKSINTQMNSSFEKFLKSYSIESIQYQQEIVLQSMLEEIKTLSNSFKEHEDLLIWAEEKFERFQMLIIHPYFSNLRKIDFIENLAKSKKILDPNSSEELKKRITTILNLIQDKALDKIQGEVSPEIAKRRKELNVKILNIQKSIYQLE